jgi:hypothetical protein
MSTGNPGLEALAAWYEVAAAQLRDLVPAQASDPAAFGQRLTAFAEAFFGAAAGAVGGGAVAAAALGPTREHRQRAAALAAALAESAAAQQALAPLLAGAAHAAASAFAARVAAGAAGSARAAFELWIDCAEYAWQDLAHGEAWCAAQARAFDAAVAVLACQQDGAAQAARLAGLPSRRELDELHRRIRDLERGA